MHWGKVSNALISISTISHIGFETEIRKQTHISSKEDRLIV